MKLILLGAPGVGKGTQAKSLAKELGIFHICSGDLLRQSVKEGSPIGKKANDFMRKGELVPDALVSELVLNRIKQLKANNGFILDGYPRNISQAIELDKTLQDYRFEIGAVIYLEAKQEIIIQRLSGRRICSNCQASFHTKNMPPKKEGTCDYCNSKLYQRPDDNEETIKNRLKIYQEETLSLIDYYQDKNKLIRITANEEAVIVLRETMDRLNDYIKITARN
ncbi:MAG: adenylate kinase [Candidatus Omnitrophota bacterium]